MRKENLEVDLQVSIIKEGKHYVAYVPSLDLSSCGKTMKEARRMIKEAIKIFFEECIKDRVLEDVLKDLGWVKKFKVV